MQTFLRSRIVRDLGIALIVVFGVGSIAMLLAHVSPFVGFYALFDGAFGTTSEFAETLVSATALLFPALGIALAFRAGLFNIGAEGQLVLGGLAAGVVGVYVGGPPIVSITAALLAGAIAGGFWGGVAGFLKARFGANEVIATLMLNVIAALFATYAVNGPLHMANANEGETALLPHAAWLPTIVPDTRLTISFVIAIVLALILRWVFNRTVFGFELRAAGEAPEAARRAGIDLSRIAMLAMTFSGAIAGLGGATIVTGVLHRFNTGLSPGYGFVAIAVALVGNLEPIWIAVAAFAFGILQNGALSMQAEANVPRDIVNVVEGLVIIALAGRRYVASRRSYANPLVTALIALIGLTLIKATPLIFAALGGVLSERSGVVNIGLEGIMIGGAFTAVCVSGATGSPILGLFAGVLAGAVLAALLAYVSTRLGFDQIVAGTGLNIVALGGAAFGLVLVYGQPGASHEVPAFGKSGEAALTVLALVLAGLLTLFLNKTPWGLRIRACGENPRAAAAAGIDPVQTRFWSVVAGGAIAALGGVYLSLAELDLYSDGMTAGRGFIALAAVIFGRWTPLGATGAALFFGFFSALQYTLQRAGIPSQLMQALPYLAALVALAGLAGRVRAPAADGIPYIPDSVRAK